MILHTFVLFNAIRDVIRFVDTLKATPGMEEVADLLEGEFELGEENSGPPSKEFEPGKYFIHAGTESDRTGKMAVVVVARVPDFVPAAYIHAEDIQCNLAAYDRLDAKWSLAYEHMQAGRLEECNKAITHEESVKLNKLSDEILPATGVYL